MARVSQVANGDVVLRFAPEEIECLEALSAEGADTFFLDEIAARRVFRTDETLKVAQRVFRAVLRARRLAAA